MGEQQYCLNTDMEGNLTYGTLTSTSDVNLTGTWYQPFGWYSTYYVEDKFGKAFKITQILMDKKLVKPNGIKQFVDLVNAIQEVL